MTIVDLKKFRWGWWERRGWMNNRAVKIIFSFAEYFITLLIFYLTTIPLHEWFHLEVVRFFGGNGEIIKTVYGGAMRITSSPNGWIGLTATAFAGGIGIAGLYALIASLDWLDDPEQFAAMIPLITSQFAYGIVEGIYLLTVPWENFVEIAQIALIIGWVVGIFISIFYVANHLWGPFWSKKE